MEKWRSEKWRSGEVAEEFEYIHEAYAREKQVQRWSRAKRRTLIEGRIGDLPALGVRGRRSTSSSHGRDSGDALPLE